MAKTDNIPAELQQMVVDAIAKAQARRAALEQEGKLLDAAGVEKEVYSQLREMLGLSTEEEFPPHLQQYVSSGLRRVLRYLFRFARQHPPTHRKGYGEESYEVIRDIPPLVFLKGGGGEGGPEPGPDSPDIPPPDEPDDEEDEPFEWVSSAEQGRAQSMLAEKADELGFGMFDEPLPFVREVAKALGGRWGLNGKRGNANDPSHDILAYDFPGHQPQLFDVLIDSGGKNELTWRALPYPQRAGAVWLKP